MLMVVQSVRDAIEHIILYAGVMLMILVPLARDLLSLLCNQLLIMIHHTMHPQCNPDNDKK